MDMVGLTLFPAITANIFCHYACKRYGMIPCVVYRAVTTLYIYILPFSPLVPDVLMSVIKLTVPLLLLGLIAALYEKQKRPLRRKNETLSRIGAVLSIVIIVAVAMVISCQFRIGALVIASESMTGEINKGDMIIYERYEDQTIKEGQVIVFKQEKNKVIHRVVRIERIGNEVRYYTKGDANPSEDAGYRIESDIVGLTDLKISYLGYPTLWMRDLLEGRN